MKADVMDQTPSCAAVRRPFPTFLNAAEPPTWGAERASRTYRERLRDWNRTVVGDLNPLPYVAYVVVTLKLFMYCWGFKAYIRNPTLPYSSEQNVKRFLLYNILGDVLGLNSTSGPLGFRMRFLFCTWYNLLMPGSITCPLVPGVPARRHPLQSFGYVLYVASMVRALRADVIDASQIAPVLALLAILTPFDLVTFQASRGEHYGYMLLCCLMQWPHALTGMRMCQAALWFWAGTAKIGPWMKYVNAFMLPNGKLVQVLSALGLPMASLFYKDAPHDVNPSTFIGLLANAAVLGASTRTRTRTLLSPSPPHPLSTPGECSLGPLCLFMPRVGVPLATASPRLRTPHTASVRSPRP